MSTVLSKPLPLGQVVITTGLHHHHQISHPELVAALRRHQNHDWGELEKEDQELNQTALETGGRIFSCYLSQQGIKFYIITEHDRSVTTLLLPNEY